MLMNLENDGPNIWEDDDRLIGSLNPITIVKQPSFHPSEMYELAQEPNNLEFSSFNELTTKAPKNKVIKKSQNKEISDYTKNICGYITKKTIKWFISETYRAHIEGLCVDHECKYEEVRKFYNSKHGILFGPNNIQQLIIPELPEQAPWKRVFLQFFIWFLKERYLRYLMLEGKMSQKLCYVHYKNTNLIPLLQKHRKLRSESQKSDSDYSFSE